MKGAEGYPPLVVKMISCSDATLMVLYDVFFASCFFPYHTNNDMLYGIYIHIYMVMVYIMVYYITVYIVYHIIFGTY